MTKSAQRVLDRVLLHLGDGVRRVEDPTEGGHLEARAEKTRARVLLIQLRHFFLIRARPRILGFVSNGTSGRRVSTTKIRGRKVGHPSADLFDDRLGGSNEILRLLAANEFERASLESRILGDPPGCGSPRIVFRTKESVDFCNFRVDLLPASR